MERDKSHTEQIERWANYVKNNPNWRKKFTPFIDSQLIMAQRVYKKLAETEEGREKIKKLRELRN